MNELIKVNNVAVTMTSLELVDFINSQRKEGESTLQHKHFLEKVPVVLGEDRSAEFSANLPDAYGRARRGYRFPKREACLMAMSYSYELQAKVFDRMTELENRTAGSRPALPDFTNPVIAARAWADEVEAKQAALVQLEAAKPSVEFVQRDSEWWVMR